MNGTWEETVAFIPLSTALSSDSTINVSIISFFLDKLNDLP